MDFIQKMKYVILTLGIIMLLISFTIPQTELPPDNPGEKLSFPVNANENFYKQNGFNHEKNNG